MSNEPSRKQQPSSGVTPNGGQPAYKSSGSNGPVAPSSNQARQPQQQQQLLIPLNSGSSSAPDTNTQSLTPSGASPSRGRLVVNSSRENEVLCPSVRRMGYSANVSDLLGEGAFSNVYKASSLLMPDKALAVKIVRTDDPNIPQAWKEHSMRRELKILKRVRHPNVITIYKIVKTRSRIFIFMDLATRSISGHLEATDQPVSEDVARNWFAGISNAISYLHSLGMAHRDLKNENILIDFEGNAKLTDFGFACFTFDKSTKTQLLSSTTCGTKAYVAPEVFNPPYDAKCADVWSLGVCLFECVTLLLPFRDDMPNPMFIKRQLEKGLIIPNKFAETLSAILQELLKRMIEPDIQKRIRSEGVVIHPWIRIIERRKREELE